MKKKLIGIFVCMLLITVSTYPVTSIANYINNVSEYQTSVISDSQQYTTYEDDEWITFKHDFQGTGYINSSGPIIHDTLWTRTYGGDVYACPVVFNGKVYIGSSFDRSFICLDAFNGDTLWSKSLPGGTGGSPAIYKGKVYQAALLNYTYCWDALTGELIWKSTDLKYGWVSSLAIHDDKLYVTKMRDMTDSILYCLDVEDGTEIWKKDFSPGDEKTGQSAPVVYEGKIYIGSGKCNIIYCLNGDNGSVIWSKDVEGRVDSTAAVVNDKVYIGGNKKLWCLNANNGSEIWSYTNNVEVWDASPSVANGKVYFSCKGVKCLDAETGEMIWNASITIGSSEFPTVCKDRIYFNSRNNCTVFCLDADNGEILWSKELYHGRVPITPAAVSYGRVYISGGDYFNSIFRCYGFIDLESKHPMTPTMDGPTSGFSGEEINYTFFSIDPDGDNLMYKVNWGEGSSYWYGPFPSGVNAIISHSWSLAGNYSITAKARDVNLKESKWSTPFNKTIIVAPPVTPSDPDPSANATDVDVNADLSWECDYLGGDPITFDVYFGANDSTPDILVSENQSETMYDPGHMNHSTLYYWKIVAWNILGESASGPVWHFTTESNVMPYQPINPEPEHLATDVDVNANLSWDGGDPDEDPVTYDVYFGNSSPPPKVVSNQSNTTYDPGTMDFNTQYYWKIVAWDYLGLMAPGYVWEFTTGSEPNIPPFKPSDPNPPDGTTNVDINADLSWTGGDPDPGDIVVYDVFFEADNPYPQIKIADDISDTTFDPGILEYSTTYYWKVKAIDNHYATRTSPVWYFITEKVPEPDLSCAGSLSWTNVKPGETVEGSFTVENIGESDTLLDWEVVDWPSDWGIWTFTPLNGDNLTPEDGELTINVSVVAPDEKNSEFTGEVKVVNKENSSDFCIVDVSLSTPKNKLFNFNFRLISWLLERFPILQKMLDVLGRFYSFYENMKGGI